MSAFKLSGTNADRLKELQARHADKNLRKKDWDLMINLILEHVPDSEWNRTIENHIPDDVLVKQALANPHNKKLLADFLRKAAKKEKRASKRSSKEPKVTVRVEEEPKLPIPNKAS